MRQEAIQRQRKPVYVSGIDCTDSYHSCHHQLEPTSYSEKREPTGDVDSPPKQYPWLHDAQSKCEEYGACAEKMNIFVLNYLLFTCITNKI